MASLPQNWNFVPLKELCQIIQYGYTASASKEPIGPKFLRITDIVPNHIDWGGVPFCKIEPNKEQKYLLSEGDIVVARTGATTGFAKRIGNHPPAVFASYLVRLRVKEGVDSRYVGHVIESDEYKRFIKTHIGGAAQPNANAQVLTSFPMPVPPVGVQQKIAAILSAYDDLIENNLRRIKILEEIAQNIYREWFVKFRFPGHANVRMVDSPLGKIPEGWEIVSIDDVATVHRGRSYRSKDLVDDGGLPFVNLKCIDRDGGFRRNGVKRYVGKYKETQKVVSGDIVMAVTDMTQERRIVARAGRVPTLDSDFGVISMDLVKIEPREGISPDYLYGYFRGSDFADNVKQQANGANVLHLSPDRIKEYQFVLPSKVMRDRFTAFSGLVFKDVENLNRRNEILRKTRDLLLPKLISGELDVSELEINTGKKAA